MKKLSSVLIKSSGTKQLAIILIYLHFAISVFLFVVIDTILNLNAVMENDYITINYQIPSLY